MLSAPKSAIESRPIVISGELARQRAIQTVCVALALALAVLLSRIVSIL